MGHTHTLRMGHTHSSATLCDRTIFQRCLPSATACLRMQHNPARVHQNTNLHTKTQQQQKRKNTPINQAVLYADRAARTQQKSKSTSQRQQPRQNAATQNAATQNAATQQQSPGTAASTAPRRASGPLLKRDMLPTPEAIATLSDTLARTGFLPSAMSLYAQLRVDDLSTLVPLTRSHRQMFEQLLELNCREGRVQTALEVFDDWKAASDLAEQAAARLTAIEVQVRASQ